MNANISSELDTSVLTFELKGVIFPNEKIVSGYRLVKDLVVFTEDRLLIIDSQGMRGKKVYYKVIPYKSILWFAMETSRDEDLDSSIKLFIGNSDSPAEVLKVDGSININNLQQLLSQALITGDLKDMLV